MNSKYLRAFGVIVGFSLPLQLLADTCTGADPSGTQCTLHVDRLRPTQFSVGQIAVDCKVAVLEEKSKKKLKKYLAKSKRRIPVVIGPDNGFYLADHHHLSAALYKSSSPKWGNEDKILHINILDNYAAKDLSMTVFWEEMQKEKRSYNSDNKGIPNMNFTLLPEDMGGLLNDPYRTLSRWVRESCGYVKAGQKQCKNVRTEHEHKAPFFMEFYWANFLRQQLPLDIGEKQVCKSIPYSATCLENESVQLKKLYKESVSLVASKHAKEYFEKLGLDPWAYGYNPSGPSIELEWTGDKNDCEDS